MNNNLYRVKNKLVSCQNCLKEFHPYPDKKQPNKFCTRKCFHEAYKKGIFKITYRKGENHVNWKGGKQKANGYIYVYSPNHPSKNVRNVYADHRLVMEKMIGRYLDTKEIVHHINGVRDDNRPENLILFSNQSTHRNFHCHNLNT